MNYLLPGTRVAVGIPSPQYIGVILDTDLRTKSVTVEHPVTKEAEIFPRTHVAPFLDDIERGVEYRESVEAKTTRTLRVMLYSHAGLPTTYGSIVSDDRHYCALRDLAACEGRLLREDEYEVPL